MPNSALISLVTRTQATPTLYNNLVKDAHRLLAVTGGTKTIASGAIAVSPGDGEGFYLVDTEGSAAADELDTISGGASGDIIALRQANSARNVMVRSGFGNILLKDDAPLALSHVQSILFRHDGSNWTPVGSAGSGGATLTNKSGATVVAGDVVVFDTGNDTAFLTTNAVKDSRVCGVALSDIANNAGGSIITGAGDLATVNCDAAAVARGQFLTTSTTAGKATAGSYFRESGTFAIALTSKAGGSIGPVTAMLIDNFRQAVVGTSGWNIGGTGGIAEKFTMATETWAGVAGAALPAERFDPCGVSSGTAAMYILLGGTSTSHSTGQSSRYKVDFSTETRSTLTASSKASNVLRSGINFTDKGLVAGGMNTSSSLENSVRKTTFATDAESSASNLSSARRSQGGVSDGTYAYIAGDTAVTCDRIDNATETIVAHSGANLGTTLEGYGFLSFPASAGYRAVNNGSVSYSRKLAFSTGTDANNASSLSGNTQRGNHCTDGVALGYMSGTAAANRLSASTDTYAAFAVYPSRDRTASGNFAAF